MDCVQWKPQHGQGLKKEEVRSAWSTGGFGDFARRGWSELVSSQQCMVGMRGHGWVSVEPRELQAGHRKTFLPMQTIGQRHRLPRDNVQSLSLEAVKTRLGKVLSISQHPTLSGCLG